MMARILVIDDTQDRLNRMRTALQPAYDVTCSGGGQQCLALIADGEGNRSCFDLIISAVHLDTDDGSSVFDLLKLVRGDERCKNAPFVMVDMDPSPSAKTLSEGLRGAADSLGATAYLFIEQFESQDFLSRVEDYMVH